MAGTFTQNRQLKSPWEPNYWFPDGSLAPFWQQTFDDGLTWETRQWSTLAKGPYQTTTSYRSGHRYGQDLSTPGNIIAANEGKLLRPYDNGHEFYTRKLTYSASHKSVTLNCLNVPGFLIKGPLVPHGANDQTTKWLSVTDFGDMDLNKASNALKQTMPTKSAASLVQALAELRQDLPSIPLATINNARTLRGLAGEAGGNYLNAVFAWQPLVQDVLKICRAVVYSADILNQYERDQGRQIRRSFNYPDVSTVNETLEGNDHLIDGYVVSSYNQGKSYGIYGNDSDLARGNYFLSTTTTTSYWFRGAWMYYLEEGTTPIERINRSAQLAKKLLGIKLDAETLWELAPWSWLIDWFTNIGDIISINSGIANDSLVLRYGYFMRRTTRRLNATHSGVTFRSYTPGPIYFQAKLEEKRRMRSTPYGFGLNTETFNAQQWAILAALGLTKGDRKMWG